MKFFVQLSLLFTNLQLSTTSISCPENCKCNADEAQVTCSGSLLLSIPERIPDGYDSLVIQNASIRSLTKQTFRKMENLREFRAEYCGLLDTLEKLAFKGLHKLRLIQFTGCPRLTEIPKASFSGIGNQHGVKIIFQNTPIQRVHGGAFRHASNIRELSISGSNLALSRNAFASITQLDFLTLSGINLVEPQLFLNSTRFHIVHIKESSFEIPPKAFEDLTHVHQILIQRCRLQSIAEDAFTGLHTVEQIELFDNHIGQLSPRAFTGAVNVGRIRIARNIIRSMDTPESILSTALQTRVEENTLDCSCGLKWIQAHPDRRLVDANYCGASGVYRSVRSFIKHQCESTSQVSSTSSTPSFVISNHDRILNSLNSLTYINMWLVSLLFILI